MPALRPAVAWNRITWPLPLLPPGTGCSARHAACDFERRQNELAKVFHYFIHSTRRQFHCFGLRYGCFPSFCDVIHPRRQPLVRNCLLQNDHGASPRNRQAKTMAHHARAIVHAGAGIFPLFCGMFPGRGDPHCPPSKTLIYEPDHSHHTGRSRKIATVGQIA